MSSVAHTRASLIDLGAQALRFWNDVRAAELRGVDSMLGHLGLQRRESALRPIFWFAAGAAAAGAVVFVLAPTQGKKLRERIMKALAERPGKKAASNGSGPVANEQQPTAAAPPH